MSQVNPVASTPSGARPGLFGPHPMVLLVCGCLFLAVLSLLLPSTPTYDPWAWIIWGREIADGQLNTREGPSWKPLPVLFTTLFAPAGDAAPALWLVIARAGALLGLVMAYRVASRLAGHGATGVAGGAIAVVALALSTDWLRNGALGNSEGLLVALSLWAVERHLDGHRGHALGLGLAAGLLRPEVWPFLGLYALYLFVREPRRRLVVATLMLLLPVLWLAPELWGSGDLFRASDRALEPNADSPAFADNPAVEVLGRAAGMLLVPVQIGALVAVALALFAPLDRRRALTVACMAAIAVTWVGIVALMTENGYSGNHRYLILAVALLAVLGGVGYARAARELGAWVAARLGRATAAPTASLAVLTLLVAGTVPFAFGPIKDLPEEAEAIELEAGSTRQLEFAVRDAGGPDRVLACGTAVTGPFEVPALAWQLRIPQEEVDVDPRLPGVVFSTRPELYGTSAGEPARVPFHPIARAGEWRVLAACASGRRQQRVDTNGSRDRRRARR